MVVSVPDEEWRGVRCPLLEQWWWFRGPGGREGRRACGLFLLDGWVVVGDGLQRNRRLTVVVTSGNQCDGDTVGAEPADQVEKQSGMDVNHLMIDQ